MIATGQPRFKALYSVGDLAEITGMSRVSVLRMLRQNGVLTIPRSPVRGQKVRISIASLAAALPDLAEGLRLAGAQPQPRRRDRDE